MSEEQMIAMGLDFAANHSATIIETIAGWLTARGVTPDEMHMALTEAAVKRQKVLKALADDAAFGVEPK